MCTTVKNICDECKQKKKIDDLQKCTLDGKEENLCYDCIIKGGMYCWGCGQFFGGINSFEFSEITGYCEHCVDQIKDNF